MQAANPFAGRCIYCAFRSRQHALRARRLHATSGNLRSTGSYSFKPNAVRSKDPIDYDNPFRPAPLGDNSHFRLVYKDQKGNNSPQEPASKVRRTNDRFPRARSAKQVDNFNDALRNRMQVAKEELKDIPLIQQLRKEADADGKTVEAFDEVWKRFATPVHAEGTPFIGLDPKRLTVLTGLREAYEARGQNGLDDRIRYAFYAHLTNSRFTTTDIRNQQALADLRYPSEWYPATRAMHRAIHLHVGPTNSGKTYQALQRLEQADTGVYAGPLRLLAHEVYSRLNAKGKPCCLITGEERRLTSQHGVPNRMGACTVEMIALNTTLDVAVIDEIQMIGSEQRGWAWTAALMGVKAKEVHLCGEERTVPLIREICASLGEKLEIHRYERLSPLKMAETSLKGRLKDLRKGDCIVSFSVMGIHALRRQIERTTGKKVATVYGSLPPETRAAQARLFNDPNNDYDYLVASDAVGMGLNLAIKRIIFEEASKYDGVKRGPLGVADIKQIAGRAGRYRVADQQMKENDKTPEQQDLAAAKGEPVPPSSLTPTPSEPPTLDAESNGLVTTLEDFDFPLVRAAMSSDPEPITSAGLFPPASVLERFSAYFPPSTPFSYVLTRLHELSQVHSRFHLCGLTDQVWIADLIEPVRGLTVADRNIISSSPASKADLELWRKLMPRYARCVAEQSGAELIEIEELPLEILDAEVSASREYLRALEQLHKGIVGYLWLSYRFYGIFTSRALAFHVKGLVEEKIEQVLGKFSFQEVTRRKLAAKREQELLREMTGTGFEAGEVTEGQEARELGAEEWERKKEGFVPGRQREGSQGEEGREIRKQTSVAFGGDRFGGEEEIAFEDPMQADVVGAEEGEAAAVSAASAGSFAEWRRQETQVDEPPTKEADLATTLSDAATEGQDVAREAAAKNELFDVERVGLPTGSDLLRDEAGIKRTTELREPSEEQSAMSPEQNPMHIEASATPEAELGSDASGTDAEAHARPIGTQETSPEPRDGSDEAQAAPPRSVHAKAEDVSGKAFAPGMPPKHLHTHLDAEVKEMGRDVTSRP